MQFLRYCAALAALSFLLSVPAAAQDLYTAEVEAGTESRQAAYEAALTDVLRRISSAELASDPDRIAALFPDPAAYVVRFQPTDEDGLAVTFDGRALESVLRRAGEFVWGGDRPTTLIWLAVDDGRDRRLVGAEDERAALPADTDEPPGWRERLQAAADERGVPVLFPLLDAEDLGVVSFADVWGGFDEQVREASRRYGVSSVLVGRISADGSRVNRWTYYFGDSAQGYTGEPEFVLARVAGRLAEEFAIGGDAPLRRVDLSISGVTSVKAYGRLQNLLEGLPILETLDIAAIEGDRIDYRVGVYGGAPRLRRALRMAGLIEESIEFPAAMPSPSPGLSERVAFFYDSESE